MPCVSVPVVPLLQLAARVWLEHGPRLFRGAGVFPWEAVDRAAATGHLLEAAGKSWFLIKIKKSYLERIVQQVWLISVSVASPSVLENDSEGLTVSSR